MEPVLIGLSGGINSMAVLCWLAEQEEKPDIVHLFYAHFKEHSPDTFQFVADGKHFKEVHVKITKNSIIEYFRKSNMIPHPSASSCSRELKIEPINQYAFENNIRIDLVGYVKEELKRRTKRQQETMQQDLFSLRKLYPIGEFTDEWCFEIVDRHIGWHPAIYDIRDENGKRKFKHNNCLPCKNMYPDDMEDVKKYYPERHFEAMKLSSEISRFWGRDSAEFYAQFGRDLGQDSTCEYCKY